jgi:hypothetical protein
MHYELQYLKINQRSRSLKSNLLIVNINLYGLQIRTNSFIRTMCINGLILLNSFIFIQWWDMKINQQNVCTYYYHCYILVYFSFYGLCHCHGNDPSNETTCTCLHKLTYAQTCTKDGHQTHFFVSDLLFPFKCQMASVSSNTHSTHLNNY